MRHRWTIGLVLVAALALWTVAPASAQTLCWVLTPDPDQVFMEIQQADATVGSFQVGITWRRGADYELEGGGAAELVNDRALVDVFVHNPTVHFNGNPQGHLHMSLDLATLSGPYAVTFTGPNPPFLAAGIAEFQGVFAPCPALLAASRAAP